ncbi:hypothetical protein [Nocardia sp. NPDC050793]|uniref:hypothetical protein n=1 Tax=Nocardia sp. NPDC050793 TaxID=3155159 RepID=UPI0033F0C087
MRRFVPAGPAAASGSVFGELRVFADRDVQLAVALTAVGNLGVVAVFTYIAPLLTEVAGFAASAMPALLLGYGIGAVAGNAGALITALGAALAVAILRRDRRAKSRRLAPALAE